MHEASVDRALGFSGSRTRLQWSSSGAYTRLQWRCGAVDGGGVLEPLARPTFSENSGKFPQNPGSHLSEILAISHHQTASFARAPITPGE